MQDSCLPQLVQNCAPANSIKFRVVQKCALTRKRVKWPGPLIIDINQLSSINKVLWSMLIKTQLNGQMLIYEAYFA